MTAERNTIYHLVSDVENEICNLEGYASLMQLAADGVASHHSAEAGDGLIRLATETTACVHRLREWHRVAHAAVGGQDDAEPVKPTEPAKSAKPTIHELCHQWDIVAAKLNLEVLERGHEQETIDHVTDPAEARWREIERAILDTEPGTIRDVDLVEMLRLARKIIGNDEYATSEAAAEAMLDLIETALVRRTGPEDWNRAD